MNDWQKAELHAERASQFYDNGQWEKALAEMRSALAVNPDKSDWLFGMGLTLDAMHRYAEAAACFRRVLGLQGDHVEAMLHLAVDLIRCDQCRKALKVLARVVEQDPDEERAYCHIILAHGRLGEHEAAEQAFYMARLISDECVLCYDHMAKSLAGTECFDRAIWCWKQVVRLDPEYPDVYAHLAGAHWATGHLERARQFFLKQLREDPSDTQTLLDFGNLLIDMGRQDEAVEKFRRALEQDPTNTDAHLHLGRVALMDDRIEEAARALREAASIDPERPGIHLRLAEVAVRRGEPDRARAYLRRELDLTDRDLDQAVELARMLVDLNMPEPVEALLTPHIDPTARRRRINDTGPAMALVCRGVSLMMRGLSSRAVSDFREALRRAPQHTGAMYSLSTACARLGRMRYAWYWLRRADRICGPSRESRRRKRLLVLATVRAWLARWIA
ncbi:MAG: hypothetical protein CMJ18_17345 [Phycisphaeraceae bacterium]|nr:hypothetical protein [Phycisphaeraceae bacterium]